MFSCQGTEENDFQKLLEFSVGKPSFLRGASSESGIFASSQLDWLELK